MLPNVPDTPEMPTPGTAGPVPRPVPPIGSGTPTSIPEQRPLGSRGVSATPFSAALEEDRRKARRRDRFALRAALWDTSTLHSVRACGRNLRGDLDEVTGVAVKRSDASAGYGHLATCGSPWACPRCTAVISVQRAEQIRRAIDHHHRAGGSVFFLTLTMRHNRGHGLAEEWDALSSGWRSCFGGPAWVGRTGRPRKNGTRKITVGDRDKLGVLGTVRTVEATHGTAGWHLHIHALIFFQEADPWGPVAAANAAVNMPAEMGSEFADNLATATRKKRLPDTPEAVEKKFADSLFERWSRGVQKAGLPAPLREHGIDLKRVADGGEAFLADYLTKNSADASAPRSEALTPAARVGLEAAAGQITKKAKGGGRTPFQILRDAVAADAEKPVKERYHWRRPKGWREEKIGDGERVWLCTDKESEDCGTVRSLDPVTGTAYSIPSADWALWHEWETASRGRRQILWSQRIEDPVNDRQRAWNAVLDARGADAEQDDEQLAERELDGDVAAGIDYRDWLKSMCRRPSRLWGLLEAVEAVPPEDAGPTAVAWGEERGIEIWRVRPEDPAD